MSDRPSPLLDLLGAHTEATQDEVDALRRTLARRSADGRVSRALMRSLPPPTPAELDALRRGVEGAHPRRMRWALPVAALGAVAAMAAVALLIVGVGVGAWLAADRDAPVAVTVAPTDGPAPHAIGDGVRLRSRGAGVVSGTERAPRVEWTAGTVEVEVEPGRGIAMVVVTREAEVRVVGTVFAVTRDALGTRVIVSRGSVTVSCVGGGNHALVPGQQTHCMPTTAPGMLGRAQELKRSGAGPAEVLATVDAALPSASGPFLGELLALRAEALLALDRHAEAVAAADDYLARGGPRVEDLLQIAVSGALADGGCAAALPYLLALEERGEGDPEQLERCEEGR
jgi:ferric-dicitrate binding protein FerR (iron transport regulator)